MGLDGSYDAPKPTLSPEAQKLINEIRQKRQESDSVKVKYGANCGATPKYAIQFPTTPTTPTEPVSVPKYGANCGSSTTNVKYGLNCGGDSGTNVKYGLNIGGSTATPKYGLNCGLKGTDK